MPSFLSEKKLPAFLNSKILHCPFTLPPISGRRLHSSSLGRSGNDVEYIPMYAWKRSLWNTFVTFSALNNYNVTSVSIWTLHWCFLYCASNTSKNTAFLHALIELQKASDKKTGSVVNLLGTTETWDHLTTVFWGAGKAESDVLECFHTQIHVRRCHFN